MKSIVDLENLLVKPYIDTKDKAYAANIAPVETSPATSAHTAGTQIIYNGGLYDVTADIAANDVLTTTGVGANIAAADDVSKQISNVKQALSDEVVTRSTLGAHNLLNYNANSSTINGVTYTVNADKSVTVSTVSGGATANTQWFLTEFSLPTGSYIMSGCPSGGSATTYLFGWRKNGVWQSNNDTGNGAEISVLSSDVLQFQVYVQSGTVITTPITFKPMVRMAEDADTTYRPYVPTNSQLLSYKDNGVLGAKNLLKNNVSSQVVNGITFTVNSDGSVTASGTSTDVVYFALRNSDLALKAGNYIISGCPSGGSSASASGGYTLYISSTGGFSIFDTGEGKAFTTSSDRSDYYVGIRIWTGTTINLTFKPMIRLASDSDETYQPYAMTNKELTELITNNITPSSYQYGSSKFSFCKCGKTIQFMGTELSADLPNGSWVNLLQLPDIYKPAIKYELNGFLDGNNPTDFYMFVITESGVVQLYRTSKNTSGVVIATRFSGSYIAAN